MKSKMRIPIELGPMCPPLQIQLLSVNLTEKGTEELDRLERDHRAVSRLHVRGIITESAFSAALKKLLRKVQSVIDVERAPSLPSR